MRREHEDYDTWERGTANFINVGKEDQQKKAGVVSVRVESTGIPSITG